MSGQSMEQNMIAEGRLLVLKAIIHSVAIMNHCGLFPSCCSGHASCSAIGQAQPQACEMAAVTCELWYHDALRDTG
ncbi:hypothetical protein P171DRAFT_427482 [Karstenula rhodostoma CBS 690.94]|uniref:Uncharacterized protein n=1 Tax=Karstenula rhodostoma CBS 690.94 TaxID=1392251 RepID=A0A9P4UHG9_9PLEO|nr:hypothetical protein P171DRAFT_427482 [Karstenula rhodostoma CBS 690.94]